jgi:pyrimidine operon attenuation protein/uracil phosphoribosyltransferase
LKNIILDQNKINKIVRRLAYQILESNINSSEIILIGIQKNGYILSKIIFEELKAITEIKSELFFVKINKKSPLKNIVFECKKEYLKNKSIVLIDDVLNTGKTLIYCTKSLLDVELNSFKTVVLIDRNHKKFPIKVDYKGISVSTSIADHIELIFEKNNTHALIK